MGKHPGQTLAATGLSGQHFSRLFHVSDTNTFTRFLVDTGSEVNVIPPTPADRRRQLDKLTLTAVNNTPICTYGKQFLNLNLGLRHPVAWIFVIAEVQKPIIRADFLQHFGLLVDMRKQQLTDGHTHIRVQGILSMDSSPYPSFPQEPR